VLLKWINFDFMVLVLKLNLIDFLLDENLTIFEFNLMISPDFLNNLILVVDLTLQLIFDLGIGLIDEIDTVLEHLADLLFFQLLETVGLHAQLLKLLRKLRQLRGCHLLLQRTAVHFLELFLG
jgi:hypothetical protein